MDDPGRLSEVFVELADTLVTDFDVVDFMTVLADRCVELLAAAEVGVLLASTDGRLHSVASSSETARILDLFELQNEEGPCLDCFRTGQPVVNHSLHIDPQPWPRFAAEAVRVGFSSVNAVPMRLRGENLGAVNIFTADGVELSDRDLAVAQALADIATISVLQERSLREARLLTEQLQGALTSRIVVEQAKGMLAERLSVDMQVAFAILREHSQRTNTKLSLVAESLLAGDLDASDFGHPRP